MFELSFEINGKKVSPDSIGDAIEAAALQVFSNKLIIIPRFAIVPVVHLLLILLSCYCWTCSCSNNSICLPVSNNSLYFKTVG